MDLNYLYQRRQVSLFRSQHADCESSRQAHLTMANTYAAQIDRAKRDSGEALRS